MGGFDWRTFLEKFSRELLEEDDIRDNLPDDVVASGWLGFDGASEADIQDLERRLGTRLPPSYREFLSVSNGWRTIGVYEPGLSPASKVEWFRERHPDEIRAWQEGERMAWKGEAPPPVPDEKYFVYGKDQDTIHMRPEYIHSLLLISNRKR